MANTKLCTHGVPEQECKKCRHATYMRRWHRKNPEKSKANARAARNRHREQRRADNRAHYRKNPEAYKARAVEWKAKHHAKVLEGQAEYRQMMREQRGREFACRRFNEGASRRGATGKITLAEFDEVVRGSGGYCFWCDARLTRWAEFDHAVPLSCGGRHVRQNIVLVCRACNKKKAYRHPRLFAPERWMTLSEAAGT